MAAPAPDDVLPWKRCALRIDDPRTLREKCTVSAALLQHGAQDTLVPVTHSRLFYNDLRALGYPVRYREITDGDHYIYWRAASYQLAFDWAAQTPPARRHRATSFTTRRTCATIALTGPQLKPSQDIRRSARLEVRLGDNAIKVNNAKRRGVHAGAARRTGQSRASRCRWKLTAKFRRKL
jgi:hypothetical protein